MFKGFKAVCGAGVACKDNDKVLGVVLLLLVRLVVMMIGWYWLWLDKIRELGIERTPTHALPQTKPPTL